MSGMLRFGIKASIACSAVYVTVDSGVWKDSETTTELYHKIKREVKPLIAPVVEQIPFDIPRLPKTGDLCSSAKTAWNKGVMASCLFLSNACDRAWDSAIDGIKYSYEKICEQVDSLQDTKT